MGPSLDRIEQKLDRVVETQSEMAANLQEHMRRTEIAEANIDKLANAIAPIQEHVAFIKGLSKLIAAAVTMSGGLLALWKMLFK